jgi:hypothetical protein
MKMENQTPTFTLVRYNPRRKARGVEAARVKVTWPAGDTEELWMSEADLRNNIRDFGSNESLANALKAYKSNVPYPHE